MRWESRGAKFPNRLLVFSDLYALDKRVDQEFSLPGLQSQEVLDELCQLISDRRHVVALYLQLVDLILQSPVLFLLPGFFLREFLDLSINETDGLGGSAR